MPKTSQRFGPAETALLLMLASMWGLSFLFVEIALRVLPPVWIVTARVCIGALVLSVIVAIRRVGLPRDLVMWRRFVLLGILNNAVPWTALAWAQQTLPSGLTALMMAMVPMSSLLVSVFVGIERMTLPRLTGLLLSLAGVALMVGGDIGDIDRVTAMLVVLAATALYAVGAVYAKQRISGQVQPLALATGQVIASSVIMLPVSLIFEPQPQLGDLDLIAIASLTALGALGTGIAFLVFYTLIARVGPTNATMVTYLVPVVAVIAGAVLLDERLGSLTLAGGIVVVIGIWLSQRALPKSPEELMERAHR